MTHVSSARGRRRPATSPVLAVGTFLVGAAMLIGCSSPGQPPAPSPSSPTASSTSATPSATAQQPQPSQATALPTTALATTATVSVRPDVPASVLPSPSGWRPRDQAKGGDGRRADTGWASNRAVDEVLPIWVSYTCGASLPRPTKVTEGAYLRPDGGSAIVEVITFDQSQQAASFVQTYLGRSVACGSATRLDARTLRRTIDGQPWTEAAVANGRTVHLVIAQGALDPKSLDAALHA